MPCALVSTSTTVISVHSYGWKRMTAPLPSSHRGWLCHAEKLSQRTKEFVSFLWDFRYEIPACLAQGKVLSVRVTAAKSPRNPSLTLTATSLVMWLHSLSCQLSRFICIVGIPSDLWPLFILWVSDGDRYEWRGMSMLALAHENKVAGFTSGGKPVPTGMGVLLGPVRNGKKVTPETYPCSGHWRESFSMQAL